MKMRNAIFLFCAFVSPYLWAEDKSPMPNVGTNPTSQMPQPPLGVAGEVPHKGQIQGDVFGQFSLGLSVGGRFSVAGNTAQSQLHSAGFWADLRSSWKSSHGEIRLGVGHKPEDRGDVALHEALATIEFTWLSVEGLTFLGRSRPQGLRVVGPKGLRVLTESALGDQDGIGVGFHSGGQEWGVRMIVTEALTLWGHDFYGLAFETPFQRRAMGALPPDSFGSSSRSASPGYLFLLSSRLPFRLGELEMNSAYGWQNKAVRIWPNVVSAESVQAWGRDLGVYEFSLTLKGFAQEEVGVWYSRCTRGLGLMGYATEGSQPVDGSQISWVADGTAPESLSRLGFGGHLPVGGREGVQPYVAGFFQHEFGSQSGEYAVTSAASASRRLTWAGAGWGAVLDGTHWLEGNVLWGVTGGSPLFRGEDGVGRRRSFWNFSVSLAAQL